MTEDELLRYLHSLKHAELAVLISLIVHMMTITARDTYEVGTEEVLDGPRLRATNEQIHRVVIGIPYALCGDDVKSVCERLAGYYIYSKENDGSAFNEGLVKDFDRAIKVFKDPSHYNVRSS